MKQGVEIDFIVTDCLQALALYESIFDIERIEVTDFAKGQNEAVFAIYGTRFHMLDENADFGMVAPKLGTPQFVWFNIVVPNIRVVHKSAVNNGCTEIQPVTEIADYGVSNSMFADPFGYIWMLHQVHREVSFEDRIRLHEKQ